MRSTLTILGALGLTVLAGCTVKSVEPPPLSGPSTLATSILLQAQPDSILQDSSTSTVTATVTGPDGRPISNLDLRAEIFVDGTAVDFGALVPKTLRTGSDGTARFIYTAPPRPSESVGTGTRVTIAVTPVGSDFRSEIRRQVDINVVPPGVILPPNGAPVPSFVITPTPANTRQTINFDASATADEGVPCLARCTYAWTFGDNTSGTGMVTTHEYRATGSYSVTLTVTDARSTSASVSQTLSVGATGPPTAKFTMSPTPVGVNQDVFFNGETSTAVTGRRIVNYGWNFGDGRTASGVTVARSYPISGVYSIALTVTDDSDAVGQATQSLTVGTPAQGPTVTLSATTPTPTTTGSSVIFNATATGPTPIVSYRFNYADGTPEDVGPAQTQSHMFTADGTYVVRVTVTDTLGRTASATTSVTIGSGGLTPLLVVSPTPVTIAAAVFFDASGTTGPSPIAIYTFNYGDGTPEDSGPASRQSHLFTTTGTFTVRLTVTDTAGRVATITLAVTVTNPGPVPAFEFLPTSPTVGALVTFNASNTTGPSPIVSYVWNFGDGGTATGLVVTHTYGTSGAKVATLTVTDSLGRTAALSQTVTVVP